MNLWRAVHSETDALALVSAVNSVASRPVLSSDGPPVGGSPLMVGGEQWGEVSRGAGRGIAVEGCPLEARSHRPVRRCGRTGRTVDGGRNIACGANSDCGDGRSVQRGAASIVRIRGSLGVFDSYHGYNEQAQFPALWSLNSNIHQGLDFRAKCLACAKT